MTAIDYTFPLEFGYQSRRHPGRGYRLEILKNQPFVNRCAQPAFTLCGEVTGLDAQAWLRTQPGVSDLVVFASEEKLFVAHCEDPEPLIVLVTLLRDQLGVSGINVTWAPPLDEHTEAWAAMLRREEQKLRIVR